MLHMPLPHALTLLDDGDLPVAEVVNPHRDAPVLLVCEHASAHIPSSLGDMGLRAVDRMSHAVWDPGAELLARVLSERLASPLVLARVSRIVHDCNRPPDRNDAMPSRVERIDIPGNRDLSPEQKAARTREVYAPFHAAVTQTLDAFVRPPALVTVHSFTPVWNGAPRETEIGLLHDTDPSLALAMLRVAPAGFRTELNAPYSAADGVTHTLAKHAAQRGLRSVMLEVRNDLLMDAAGVERVADALAAMLQSALGAERGAA